MPERSEIKIADLDFDDIKSSLKNYLQTQEEFKDYNFEGSGMSILLDLLAYNTHYQSFYANMVANEMFLDSAIVRNSVVSLAKHLAYVPKSVTAPIATVDVNFSTSPGAFLERGSVFSSTAGGESYTFVTLSAYPYEYDANTEVYSAKNVQLYEGRLNTISFIVDENNPDQKFIIPDKMVDTRTITVRVQKSTTDTTGFVDLWEPVNNVIDLTSSSKAYFIQEVEDGLFEIYFGDNIISEGIDDGNLIIIEYLSTNGVKANGMGTTDKATSRVFNFGTSNVEVVAAAGGGADRESTDSIKYYAPLAYQAQERAVTTNDYEYILLRDYPDVESALIWGGEDNDPPQYGKVFISLKPIAGRYISETEKLSIASDLIKRRNIVAITPEVVDPEYVFLNFTSTINYDGRKTARSSNDLGNLVYEQIVDYIDNDLEKFGKALYLSDFQRRIDDLDDAILSNETSVVLEYRLSPTLNRKTTYEFSFGNALFHPHDGHMPIISSDSFVHYDGVGKNVTAFIDDDGKGKLRLYSFVDGEKTYFNEDAGSIDYDTGKLVLKDFMPVSITNVTAIKIKSVPQNQDVASLRNNILTIDTNDLAAVNLTMNDVSAGGTNNFTIKSTSTSTTTSTSTSGSGTSSSSGSSAY